MSEFKNILLSKRPPSPKLNEVIREFRGLSIDIADKDDPRRIARNMRVCLEATLDLIAQSWAADNLRAPRDTNGNVRLSTWLSEVGKKIEPDVHKKIPIGHSGYPQLHEAPKNTVYHLIDVGNAGSHSIKEDMTPEERRKHEKRERKLKELTDRPELRIWNPLVLFLFKGLKIDDPVPKVAGDPLKSNLIAMNSELREKLKEEEYQKNAIRADLKRTEDKISDREDLVQELEKDNRLRSVFREADKSSLDNARILAKTFIGQYATETTSGLAKSILDAARSTTDPKALEKIKQLEQEKREADERSTQKAEQSEKLQEEIINLKEERTKLLSQIDSYSPWADEYPFKDGEPDWPAASSMLDQRIKESEAPFGDYKFLRTVSDDLLGKQGMVYKARHKNGQTVAIKLPLRLDAGYHYEAAFYRKALKADQPIPGLIQPVPDGIAPPATPGYIILQWEDGLRLDEWVHNHEGALRESGRLFAVALKHGEQILTTLQALWKEDLIFTDLHPGNIMMRPGDRPMLLDPGGLVAASSLPELKTMASLIAATDSSEALPDLFASKRKELASMYLAMTTDLILYIASGGKHDVFGSTDANSQFVDQSKERGEKIKGILHDSEIFPHGEGYDDRIELGRSSLDRLFQAWSNPQFREDECNSSTGLPRNWFRDYRSDLLSLIDPYKAYRPIQ